MNEENKKFVRGALAMVFICPTLFAVGILSDNFRKAIVNHKIKATEDANNKDYKYKANMDWKSFDKLPIYEEAPDMCLKYAKKDMIRERNGDVVIKVTLPNNRCRMKHPNLKKYGE